MVQTFEHEALFELRFWMQILGDHARFIRDSLSVQETVEIEKTKNFILLFDELLQKARLSLSKNDLLLLLRRAKEAGEQLRTFKLHLLKRHLTAKISLSLPPTFINHMVNELDEWLRIASYLVEGKNAPAVHPLHHDLLWLLDAAGHAGAINDDLDSTETKLKEKSYTFVKDWEAFYLKAVEMAGYLRTNLHSFPALSRFHKEIELEMLLFKKFLKELEELRLTKEVLGTFTPLMADHMSREECYYLQKLAGSTQQVSRPSCDPTKPRTE
ncbi:MAG TPA: DUF2935 domain-containing protein [Anoxybacillus sp.]|nr:DUF2935 domain-containing protein [Anoxybacillus sp.]